MADYWETFGPDATKPAYHVVSKEEQHARNLLKEIWTLSLWGMGEDNLYRYHEDDETSQIQFLQRRLTAIRHLAEQETGLR